jgi:hypothetical protein
MRPSVGMTIRRSRTPFGRWRSAQLSLPRTRSCCRVDVVVAPRYASSPDVRSRLVRPESPRFAALGRGRADRDACVASQLRVLERSRRPRVRLTRLDRFLWVWLSRTWPEWRRALVIVNPETVIAWHRQGFRLFWTWKSRHRTGRPGVPDGVRALIRTMSAANPLWGAPGIHGELLKLGIDVGLTSMATYMIRCRQPPSQTWKTFPGESRRANHEKGLGSDMERPFVNS